MVLILSSFPAAKANNSHSFSVLFAAKYNSKPFLYSCITGLEIKTFSISAKVTCWLKMELPVYQLRSKLPLIFVDSSGTGPCKC